MNYITQLKSLRIPFEAEQAQDGNWICWAIDAPGLWGQGSDFEDSIDNMILQWREGLAMLTEDHMQPLPESMTFYAKVLISTDEELRECLSGEICAAS